MLTPACVIEVSHIGMTECFSKYIEDFLPCELALLAHTVVAPEMDAEIVTMSGGLEASTL